MGSERSFATRRITPSVVLVLLLASLTGCLQPAPPLSESTSEARGEAIYVLLGGWHTELALPLSQIDSPLAALKSEFPGARTLVFGWGARDYYMAPNPGLAEAMRALSPGPAVMLVMGQPAASARSDNAFVVYLSHQGAARLSQWLWNELAKDGAGQPHRIAAGPSPQSLFYAATGSYDASHTCNTWTAEALRIAGLPIDANVVFADQVTAQLAPFATPTSTQQEVLR